VLGQGGLVLVAEQVVGAGQQRTDLLAVQPGELPRRVGRERDLVLDALLGEREHRVGVAGADHDELDPAGQLAEVDLPVLRHRARVERGDLVHVEVGRGHVPGRMVPRRLPDAAGVDAVPVQPLAVAGEVALPRRADEQRPQAQAAEPERDVRRDAAAPDLERVDEEGQRDLVEFVRHELLDKPGRERHQVVGRDRPRDCNAHGSPSGDAEPLSCGPAGDRPG